MRWRAAAVAMFAGLCAAGCSPAPVVPADPTWVDVAPIFRGACNSCHGWTAPQTGGSYRFDFFDMTEAACGDAAKALDPGVILAGSALATSSIHSDVVAQGGSTWARMPPPPSPALPAWEQEALERWSASPLPGAAPPHNLPPALDVQGFPSVADQTLAFTVVLSDPDADAALGVIQVSDLAFLRMNRTGSFAVTFDSSSWPAGPQPVTAVVCDGWAQGTYNFGTVMVWHPTAAR